MILWTEVPCSRKVKRLHSGVRSEYSHLKDDTPIRSYPARPCSRESARLREAASCHLWSGALGWVLE